jgi:hypothetical protein
VDLCFTLAAAGHRIAYVPASAVIHVRDASGGSKSLADTAALNHRFFESRWRATLRSRPSPALFDRPQGSLLARDARASGRILVTGAAVDDVPMMLAMDPRLLVTVVGREAAGLEPLVEVVPHAKDWTRWFGHRRHHYDLIVGHDDRSRPSSRTRSRWRTASLALRPRHWPPTAASGGRRWSERAHVLRRWAGHRGGAPAWGACVASDAVEQGCPSIGAHVVLRSCLTSQNWTSPARARRSRRQ